MRLIGFYFCYYIDKNIIYSIYICVFSVVNIFKFRKENIYNRCMFDIWILLNKREMENKIFLCNIIWFVLEYVFLKLFDIYEGLNLILIIVLLVGFFVVFFIFVVVLFVILRYIIFMYFYEL